MNIRTLCFVSAFLLLVSGIALAQTQFYPGSTDRCNYYVAGQRRPLLQGTPWGGVFYIPDRMGSMEFSQGLPTGTSTITSMFQWDRTLLVQ